MSKKSSKAKPSKLLTLLEAFDTAAQWHGYAKDQGTGGQARDAKIEYLTAKAALQREFTRMQKRLLAARRPKAEPPRPIPGLDNLLTTEEFNEILAKHPINKGDT